MPYEMSRITIVKTIEDDDRNTPAIGVNYSGDMTLFDAVGMLAFVQATVLEDFQLADDDETDETGGDG